MLVLSRKKGESVVINDDITIVVIEIRGDKVRLGVEAPKDTPVHRSEVHAAILENEGRNLSLAEEPVGEHFYAIRKRDGARCILWKFTNAAGTVLWSCNRGHHVKDSDYTIGGPVPWEGAA